MSNKFFVALVAGFLALSSVAVMAAGLDLTTAKTQGIIGELPTGLIGAVDNTSADVVALVETVNAGRLKHYQQIAANNGTPVDQVQAVAGQKLITETPAGQYIQNAAGKWQKK